MRYSSVLHRIEFERINNGCQFPGRAFRTLQKSEGEKFKNSENSCQGFFWRVIETTTVRKSSSLLCHERFETKDTGRQKINSFRSSCGCDSHLKKKEEEDSLWWNPILMRLTRSDACWLTSATATVFSNCFITSQRLNSQKRKKNKNVFTIWYLIEEKGTAR